MSEHSSLEQLNNVLLETRKRFPVGSLLPSTSAADPQRNVCTYAIDEESEQPGVVYEFTYGPRQLRFCPVNLLTELNMPVSRSTLSVSSQQPRKILDGTCWQHSKTGGRYRIVQKAVSDVSGLEGVLYYPQANERVHFFRSLLSFLGEVELDGKLQPRFKQIDVITFVDLPRRG